MSVELAYDEAGSGPPVLLLHAFPFSRAIFADQLSGLADRARVIVPDLRGFGETPATPDDEPVLDLMAGDVVALLDRLGVDSCVLGGLSLGGYIAMSMLRDHSHRVSAVILMDTKAGADNPAARENRERVATAVLEHGPRALTPMLDSLLGATTRRDRPDVVAQVARWLDAARPHGVAWAQRAMATRLDSFGTLAGAPVPGFVIVGAEDALSPQDEARAMAAVFQPAAPVYVIPGAGHLSSVENPDAVTGAIRDALRHF